MEADDQNVPPLHFPETEDHDMYQASSGKVLEPDQQQ